MARTPEVPFVDETALHDEVVLHDEAGEERWPALSTALFVVVASATLWALIIGAIHWLVF